MFDPHAATACTTASPRLSSWSIFEPFGLVGVESLLCGTPIIAADNVGCVEVIRAPGQYTFSLDHDESLGEAVVQAVAAWRSNTPRLTEPLATLGYDPSVDAHVRGLLALAAQVQAQ